MGWIGEPIYHYFGQRLLKAICLLVKDEINLLRAEHGLPPRTNQQIHTALLNKYNETTGDVENKPI